VATGGYDLPARWVIHTVGPNRHRGQTDPALLASCFGRSLDVAAGLGARSVAFPAVSAGVYGWPVDEVARIATTTVRTWSPPPSPSADQGTPPADQGTPRHDQGTPGDHPVQAEPGVELVRFVLFGPAALAAFEQALAVDPPP
jgi:O-acetyl-ADP-ribose deacetylase